MKAIPLCLISLFLFLSSCSPRVSINISPPRLINIASCEMVGAKEELIIAILGAAKRKAEKDGYTIRTFPAGKKTGWREITIVSMNDIVVDAYCVPTLYVSRGGEN